MPSVSEVGAMELGAAQCLLSSIKTRVDGSVTVSLEVNPTEIQLINKLMRCYLDNERDVTCAFVLNNGVSNGQG